MTPKKVHGALPEIQVNGVVSEGDICCKNRGPILYIYTKIISISKMKIYWTMMDFAFQ